MIPQAPKGRRWVPEVMTLEYFSPKNADSGRVRNRTSFTFNKPALSTIFIHRLSFVVQDYVAISQHNIRKDALIKLSDTSDNLVTGMFDKVVPEFTGGLVDEAATLNGKFILALAYDSFEGWVKFPDKPKIEIWWGNTNTQTADAWIDVQIQYYTLMIDQNI